MVSNLFHRYDMIDNLVPNAFSYLLEEVHRLEAELGHLPQKWKVLWDKLELPNTDSLTVCPVQLSHFWLETYMS